MRTLVVRTRWAGWAPGYTDPWDVRDLRRQLGLPAPRARARMRERRRAILSSRRPPRRQPNSRLARMLTDVRTKPFLGLPPSVRKVVQQRSQAFVQSMETRSLASGPDDEDDHGEEDYEDLDIQGLGSIASGSSVSGSSASGSKDTESESRSWVSGVGASTVSGGSGGTDTGLGSSDTQSRNDMSSGSTVSGTDHDTSTTPSMNDDDDIRRLLDRVQRDASAARRQEMLAKRLARFGSGSPGHSGSVGSV